MTCTLGSVTCPSWRVLRPRRMSSWHARRRRKGACSPLARDATKRCRRASTAGCTSGCGRRRGGGRRRRGSVCSRRRGASTGGPKTTCGISQQCTARSGGGSEARRSDVSTARFAQTQQHLRCAWQRSSCFSADVHHRGPHSAREGNGLAAVLAHKHRASVEVGVVHRFHRALGLLRGGELDDATPARAARALREHVSTSDLSARSKVVLESLPRRRPRQVAHKHTAVLLTVSSSLSALAVLAGAWLFSALLLLPAKLSHRHHGLLAHLGSVGILDELIQDTPELVESGGRDDDCGAVRSRHLSDTKVSAPSVLPEIEEDALLLNGESGPPDVNVIHHSFGLFQRCGHSLRHPPHSGWFDDSLEP
mmetsp:Transcript_48963/g.98099  ORF Transcript_48963/g.98099 Transcript_48963/m.98099 type:complete len:365 (+) Transcript_48963:663-1757(+)